MDIWWGICKSYSITILPLQGFVGFSPEGEKMGKNQVNTVFR